MHRHMVGELSDLQNDRRGHARHGCRRGPAGQRDFDIVDIQGVSPTAGVSVFVLPCEQGRFDEGDLFGKCPVRLRDLFRITVMGPVARRRSRRMVAARRSDAVAESKRSVMLGVSGSLPHRQHQSFDPPSLSQSGQCPEVSSRRCDRVMNAGPFTRSEGGAAQSRSCARLALPEPWPSPSHRGGPSA